jgi:glutamate synthase domain-containing protein 3
MSGGMAYVLDVDGQFKRRANLEMVDLEPLIDADDIDFLRVAIVKHATYTDSRYAEALLADWGNVIRRFVKVMPRDYKKAMAAEAKRKVETKIDHAALVTVGAKKGSVAAGQTAHG